MAEAPDAPEAPEGVEDSPMLTSWPDTPSILPLDPPLEEEMPPKQNPTPDKAAKYVRCLGEGPVEPCLKET